MNKHRSRAAAFLPIVVLVTGCSQAPEYVRPVAPVPAQWPQQAAAADAPGAAGADWNVFFPDPRLQALVAAALVHNRDLQVATARVAEARALYGVQKADRLPTVNLGASGNSARVPGDISAVGHPVISRRYDVNLGMAAFELDFWGRVSSLRDAALANYLASEQAQRSFRLSLVADVVDAYLTQQEMRQRRAIAQETLRSREESRRLISRRREVGLAGDLDYLAAESAYQTVRSEIAALERQGAAADNALRLLVGGMPEDLPPARKLTEQGGEAELAVGLPAATLLKRPDVQAAEQALIAANANIGAARAAFFPRIALTAAYGTASNALSGLFAAGSEAWSFQPVLSLPLFDGGRNQANADLAEARKVIAVAQYEKTVQQAFREVADLLAARAQLRQQLDAQQAGEQSLGQRLRLTEARYQGGVASYLELLDAQREFLTAQQASVQLRRQWLSAGNQLYKALGGA
jgi:multidrug efflux system outer membrane protein